MGSSNNAFPWVPPGEGDCLPVAFENKKKLVCSYYFKIQYILTDNLLWAFHVKTRQFGSKDEVWLIII